MLTVVAFSPSVVAVLSAAWGSDAATKIAANTIKGPCHPLRLNTDTDLAEGEASEFLKLASVRQEHASHHMYSFSADLQPISPPMLDLPAYVRPLLDRYLAQHYPGERLLVASFSVWQMTVRLILVILTALVALLPYMIAVPFLRILFPAISVLTPLLVAVALIFTFRGLANGVVLTNRRLLRVGTPLPGCPLLFSARQVADLSDPAFRDRYLSYELHPRDGTGEPLAKELFSHAQSAEAVQALCNYLVRVATHSFVDKTDI